MYISKFEKYQNDNKHILITGGTGFIGKQLIEVLILLKYDITVLTRDIQSAKNIFDSSTIKIVDDLSEIDKTTKIDAIINLAGESLASGRWNNKRKTTFIQSRLNTTINICELIERLEYKPEVLINGSAIGYYGPQQNTKLSEDGTTVDCFSHKLCKTWEEQALKAGSSHTRVCLLRIGIVLDSDGGSFAELSLPYKFGFSMQVANGQQWMSWIHRDDLIGIILHAICNTKISGAINGTAPRPVTNKDFANTLSLFFKTYIRLKFPASVLNLLVGELANEFLITGQRVIPNKIQNNGYIFIYPELSEALKKIVGPQLK